MCFTNPKGLTGWTGGSVDVLYLSFSEALTLSSVASPWTKCRLEEVYGRVVEKQLNVWVQRVVVDGTKPTRGKTVQPGIDSGAPHCCPTSLLGT